MTVMTASSNLEVTSFAHVAEAVGMGWRRGLLLTIQSKISWFVIHHHIYPPRQYPSDFSIAIHLKVKKGMAGDGVRITISQLKLDAFENGVFPFAVDRVTGVGCT